MSLFDILRQQKIELDQQRRQQSSTDILIRLTLDDKGAYIQIINKKGEEVYPDYSAFSGAVRSLMHSISSIMDKNAFLISWDNPENRIYLNEYAYLIQGILSSGLLVDQDFRPIESDKPVAGNSGAQLPTLRLRLSPLETKADSSLLPSYSAELLLEASGASFEKEAAIYRNFWFLTENYVLLPKENRIIETKPVGPFFSQVRIFNTEKILPGDLFKYLSLLFTYIETVSVDLPGYRIRMEQDILKPRPAIIFEKVDEAQHLTIRIGQHLPNTPVEFLEQYAVSRLAAINEMEKVVSVYNVEPVDIRKHVDRISTILKKHLPKGQKKTLDLLTVQDHQFTLHESLAEPFIYKELSQLTEEFDLIGHEKLKAFKIKVDQPRLDLSLGHRIDFLESSGSASLDFEGQKVSIMDAIRQYDKNRYIRLTDGTHALINESYMNRLKRLFKKSKDKKGEITVSFFDLPALEELIEKNQRTQLFADARAVYEGFNHLQQKNISLPFLQAELRPYQLQGFQWISYLQTHQLGGCLADDMGLGKTIQTIAVLAAAYSAHDKRGSSKKTTARGKTPKAAASDKKSALKSAAAADQEALPPSIIIMPKSLLYNWQNELSRFAPGLSVYIWYGQNRDIRQATGHQIILTTYSMYRNDIEIWKEQQFLYGILDESQAIKNMNSQVHKAVLLLRARHRLALSGTPVENNLGELYALFRFLNPALLGTTEQFQSDYIYPIQKNNDREVITELRRKIYPFILRRLKKDVLTDLPDKQEQTMYVEMNKAQAKYYEERRLFYKEAIEQQVATKGIQQSQFFIFQAMNELRQIASIPEAKTEGRIESPKLEALMEQLEEAIANDHKILIFVNYLSAIESIGAALDKLGIGFLTMTGSTRDRQGLVDRFQNDPEIRVFILTLKTGGTGLNLTAADMVFIFDPWWNKAAENQAIDRAHRIGQTHKVQSYKLITLGSIEEKILQLQELKSALFEDLISADAAGNTGSVKSMTEEDIRFILG
ncbi:Superfamily II DNA or RNA helicase, SNF2 family [Arachidicoccus rhizosphaerae]|uniref:Superfamily II DNA or RNA helicase, SNF2 family n=1 Tax=Arachidicoccus rhizosphaerae TaxID=551991 RepID=A0A1H4ABM6_9BACT|nr:DEAD/DEAH box helicase [Arachidicoccus rhizosphaerae]SEA33415.1 Superfamily II DNA or RNA helicase, SNF2 family [Arachidicoccus rhizosphaerae]